MSDLSEEHKSSEDKGKTSSDNTPTEIKYIEKKENHHGPNKDHSEPQKQTSEQQPEKKQPSDDRKVDSIENYDLSEPKSIIHRLGDYAIVNKAFTTYDYIKNASPLLNAGLSSAENATAIAFAYTAPVIVPRVQPILQAVDAKFGVEEKANQLLDIVESQVANASDTIHNTTAYVSSSKNAAQEKILALPGKSYEVLVDRPLEQLLERLEELLDRFLPQTFDVEKVDASKLKDQSKIQRATHLGMEVPKRIVNLAQHKYQTLQLTEDQLPGFAFLIDLIQYSVEQIDLNAKKAQASEVYATAKTRILEGKDRVSGIVQDGKTKVEERLGDVNEQYVSPLKNIIEKRLEEIKQSDLRTYAGVMAALSQQVLATTNQDTYVRFIRRA